MTTAAMVLSKASLTAMDTALAYGTGHQCGRPASDPMYTHTVSWMVAMKIRDPAVFLSHNNSPTCYWFRPCVFIWPKG